MFEARIKLGQYLYLKHGAKVVFLGRARRERQCSRAAEQRDEIAAS
jgi:hypothetical protein